ncbi:MAG: hypothetical protein ACLRL4_10380 [Bifidobacterium bifidum]
MTVAENEVTAREQAVKRAEAKLKDMQAVVDGYAKAEERLKVAQQAYDEAAKALAAAQADQRDRARRPGRGGGEGEDGRRGIRQGEGRV